METQPQSTGSPADQNPPRQKRQYRKSSHPANKEFARIYTKGDKSKGIKPGNATAAYQEVFGAAGSPGSTRELASQKLTNLDVQRDIADYRKELEGLQASANAVFRNHLESEKVPPVIKQRAAEYVSDQNYGKASQKVEVRSQHVHVMYDLSGGQAGAVPQSVLDELEAKKKTTVQG